MLQIAQQVPRAPSQRCVKLGGGHAPLSLLGEFPAVKAWLERCQSRKAFKKMWAARNAEPV